MDQKSFFSKIFKSSEEVVSMFLGLVIVLVVVGMVVNYFNRKRGSVELPGLTENATLSDVGKSDNRENDSTKYKVVLGDSLWKIAVSRYGNGFEWTKIAKENGLKSNVLAIGQELKMPKIDKVVTGEKTELKKVELINNQQTDAYRVVRGDSLWKIAVKHMGDGYSWTKIWKLNRSKLRDPGKLEIGMVLNLK